MLRPMQAFLNHLFFFTNLKFSFSPFCSKSVICLFCSTVIGTSQNSIVLYSTLDSTLLLIVGLLHRHRFLISIFDLCHHAHSFCGMRATTSLQLEAMKASITHWQANKFASRIS
ncbi:hypothetical protein HYPSUDRAFT_891193 [Hypholoma sublateritium FD-334 SS-4]|uniref:Uncharacterized protein n=1 Tax=Hypholoma sublateritium (strain FD-334 SS-4) TaxID=945553 RepID=A0A0D2NKU1_HYPSF|nr:hypothetical protein HYPSUDRAFT_891193 [Hypholoma sublateritium FD-334 SS-4]